MQVKLGTRTYNTDTASKQRMRTTIESPFPRVDYKKTEILYQQSHKPYSYFTLVTIEKIIDNQTVKSYTWIQEVDKEELDEFLQLPPLSRRTRHRDPIEPKEPQNRNEYFRNYYHSHKDKIKEYTLKYRQKNKDTLNQKAKDYYQEHKEEILQRQKNYNKKD